MSSKVHKLLDRSSFQIKRAFWFGYGKLNCSPVELLNSGRCEKGCPKIWKIVCYLNEGKCFWPSDACGGESGIGAASVDVIRFFSVVMRFSAYDHPASHLAYKPSLIETNS